MALNKVRLKNALKAALLVLVPGATETNPVTEEADPNIDKACQAIADEIVDEVLNNIVIQIPTGEVIVSVTGGSGNPAVGLSNGAPIDCDVT